MSMAQTDVHRMRTLRTAISADISAFSVAHMETDSYPRNISELKTVIHLR